MTRSRSRYLMSRVEFFSDLASLFGNGLIALRFGTQLACVLSQA
jgi:hypothetical protein